MLSNSIQASVLHRNHSGNAISALCNRCIGTNFAKRSDWADEKPAGNCRISSTFTIRTCLESPVHPTRAALHCASLSKRARETAKSARVRRLLPRSGHSRSPRSPNRCGTYRRRGRAGAAGALLGGAPSHSQLKLITETDAAPSFTWQACERAGPSFYSRPTSAAPVGRRHSNWSRRNIGRSTPVRPVFYAASRPPEGRSALGSFAPTRVFRRFRSPFPIRSGKSLRYWQCIWYFRL